MLVRGDDPPEPPARPSPWFGLVTVGLVALIAPLSRLGWLPLIRLLVHRSVLVFARFVRFHKVILPTWTDFSRMSTGQRG